MIDTQRRANVAYFVLCVFIASAALAAADSVGGSGVDIHNAIDRNSNLIDPSAAAHAAQTLEWAQLDGNTGSSVGESRAFGRRAENPAGFTGMCAKGVTCTSVGSCDDFDLGSSASTAAPSASDGGTTAAADDAATTASAGADETTASPEATAPPSAGRRLLQETTVVADGTTAASETGSTTAAGGDTVTTTPASSIACTCCDAVTVGVATTLGQCWGQTPVAAEAGMILSTEWANKASAIDCTAAASDSVTSVAISIATTPAGASAETTPAGATAETTPAGATADTTAAADTTTPVPERRQTTRDKQPFCVQYTAEVGGSSYTAGGCLGQLVGQDALSAIKCEYDGQRSEISAAFLGKGDAITLTVYCCLTPLCNKCPALEKVTTTSNRRMPFQLHGGQGERESDDGERETDNRERDLSLSLSRAHRREGEATTAASEVTTASNVDTLGTTASNANTLGTTASANGALATTLPALATTPTPQPDTAVGDVYQCARTVAPVTKVILGGLNVVQIASESFTLPSADILAREGFTFKFSDAKYSNLGAVIPPGAWPPGDTRTPSLTLYEPESKTRNLDVKSDKKGSQLAGLLIDFQPSPITFSVPVTVSLPVDDPDSKWELSVAMFEPASSSWVLKPVSGGKDTLVNAAALGETSSFSLYAALSYPKSSRRCNTACIIGAVIGAVAGALCICLCLWFCFVGGGSEDEVETESGTPRGDDEEEEEVLSGSKRSLSENTRDLSPDDTTNPQSKNARDLEEGKAPSNIYPSPYPHPPASDEIYGEEGEEHEEGEHIYDV